MIRPARVEDFAALQRIEVEAGRAFADVGYPDVAADDPFSDEELDQARADGRLWVAVPDGGGEPVGYVLTRVVGGRAHVEQVSVLPEHQGLGIGRALLEQAYAWGATIGSAVITLSTFRDVPFNAPLYAHLGFRILAESELDEALRAERVHEAAHGLDTAARVFMTRPL